MAPRKSSSDHLKKSPGGGPPLLLMRISGFGQALSKASLVEPSSIGPRIEVTL